MKSRAQNRRKTSVIQVLSIGGILAGAFGLATAFAADEAGMVEDGDLLTDRASAIAQSCAACHGTGGKLETAIPSLAGKPEPVLTAQLLSFKRDQMPGATVMPRLARGYTDEELQAVARYFASLNPDDK